MKGSRENAVVLQDLDQVLARAVRVVVKSSPMEGAAILFESTDRQDLDDLRSSLTLDPPGEWFHCMCNGSPALYVYQPNGELTLLTNHHGVTLRSSLWSSDVRISDPEKWLSWFDHRGIPGPRQEVEAAAVRAEASKAARARWRAAMPRAIVPGWSAAVNEWGSVDIAPLHKALERDIRSEQQRILALLEWFGSGAGPWSGFPAYEAAAEDLLLKYPTTAIVEAIEASSISPAQTEGAARLFGGWGFRRQRPAGLNELPQALKRRLWTHVKATEDQDKLDRARRAFTE